jgi:kynurenine formamidase
MNSVKSVADAFVARAVLIDVARFRKAAALAPGETVTARELEAAAAAQGVRVERGDALLVRTGFLGECERADDWKRYTDGPSPGLALDTVVFLQDSQVAMVAADTRRVEVGPSEVATMSAPFHSVGIAHMGLTLGETFALDALADACSKDRRYVGLLIAPPVAFSRAVGAPVNPYVLR